MNNITMVRTLRELVGMQGTGPASVLSATGVESVLVTMINTAYDDVQNLREDFDFLNAKQTFNTVIGQSEYSVAEIYGFDADHHKTYDRDSFWITNGDGKKTRLVYMDREVFEQRFANASTGGLPQYFTIDYADQSIVLQPNPDASCTINFRYYRSPEILSADAQIPILPATFHYLIVYKAIEKMAIYLNSQASFQEYELAARKLQGQLMRYGLRKKTLKAGALA